MNLLLLPSNYIFVAVILKRGKGLYFPCNNVYFQYFNFAYNNYYYIKSLSSQFVKFPWPYRVTIIFCHIPQPKDDSCVLDADPIEAKPDSAPCPTSSLTTMLSEDSATTNPVTTDNDKSCMESTADKATSTSPCRHSLEENLHIQGGLYCCIIR